jgi:hypothetical protein
MDGANGLADQADNDARTPAAVTSLVLSRQAGPWAAKANRFITF